MDHLGKTSPIIDRKPFEQTNTSASVIDQELSNFLIKLIENGNCLSHDQEPSEELRTKIHEIKHSPGLREIHTPDEINELRSVIHHELAQGDFTAQERVFCELLIDTYLSTPGYKKYQSYFLTLWNKNFEGIGLSKIENFIKAKEQAINTLKENSYLQYREFKQAYSPTLQMACELHQQFVAYFSNEEKPSFNQDNFLVECSLEQLEFATGVARASFANFMHKARNPKQVAYVTRLIQVILCGEQANTAQLPMNPVCIILRETKNQCSVPISIGLNWKTSKLCDFAMQSMNTEGKEAAQKSETLEQEAVGEVETCLNQFLSTRPANILSASAKSPTLIFETSADNSASLSGRFDLFHPNCEYPFDSVCARFPVASVKTSVQLPDSPHFTEMDGEAMPPLMAMNELCVNWAAPASFRENLVCYLRDPALEPHQFTHPLTGRNLNKFADRAVALFESFSVDENDHQTFANFSPDEILAYKRKIQLACEAKSTIKIETCRGLEDEEKDIFGPFVEALVDVFSSSATVDNFKAKLRTLTAKQEYSEDFLTRLYAVLEKNAKRLQTYFQCHVKFKMSYERTVDICLRYNQLMRQAFASEKAPEIDLTTGIITVSFARFRLAKQLFDLDYAWMVAFAGNKEEETLASHILAILLCGKDAPPCELLSKNPRCFLMREFADGSLEPLRKVCRLNDQLSYNQQLFNELAGQFETTEEDQFRASFGKAVSLFIGDAVVRNRYEIQAGEDHYTTKFTTEADLSKPFYLVKILEGYLRNLRNDEERAKRIRQTPFALLVKKHLSMDLLREEFLKNVNSTFTGKVIDKILDYLIKVPEDLRDLALLKLLELMCFINQHLSLSFGDHLIKVCREIPDADAPYELSPNNDSPFFFSIDSPQCEAISCKTNIELVMQKKSVVVATSKSRMVISFQPIRPAQLEFVMKIPSMTAADHKKAHSCPEVSLCKIAFSAAAPVSLIDLLSSELNPGFVRSEIGMHCSPEGLQVDLQEVIKEFAQLDHLLSQANFSHFSVFAFLQAKFLAAYRIIKKMEIQKLLLSNEKNPENIAENKKRWEELNRNLKHANDRLKKIYVDVAKRFNGKTVVPCQEFIDFRNQIKDWFLRFFK